MAVAEVPEVPPAVVAVRRVVAVAVVRAPAAVVGRVLQTRVATVRMETVLPMELPVARVVRRVAVPVATRTLLVMPAVEEVVAVSMAEAAVAVQLPQMPAAVAAAAVQTR